MTRSHIPHRMCVGCRERRPKRELLRLVPGRDGSVAIDEDQQLSGRGVYLCCKRECIDTAFTQRELKRCLNRPSLRSEIALRFASAETG